MMELTLTEENELGFKLRIEGSDKEISSTKPNIRFTLTEQDTGKGWIFPTDRTEEGVSVTIPEMKGILSENKDYQGKLEVVLAGRYFEPTIVDIKFIEPLKVEAAVSVVRKHNKILEEHLPQNTKTTEVKELTVESKIEKIAKPKKEAEDKQITFKSINEDKELDSVDPNHMAILEVLTKETKPTSYNDLSASQKEIVNNMFLEQCVEYGISKREVKKLMKEGSLQVKNKLQTLLAKSFKDYLETI